MRCTSVFHNSLFSSLKKEIGDVHRTSEARIGSVFRVHLTVEGNGLATRGQDADLRAAVGIDGELVRVGIFVVRGGEADFLAPLFAVLHFIGLDAGVEVQGLSTAVGYAVGLTHVGQIG